MFIEFNIDYGSLVLIWIGNFSRLNNSGLDRYYFSFAEIKCKFTRGYQLWFLFLPIVLATHKVIDVKFLKMLVKC